MLNTFFYRNTVYKNHQAQISEIFWELIKNHPEGNLSQMFFSDVSFSNFKKCIQELQRKVIVCGLVSYYYVSHRS